MAPLRFSWSALQASTRLPFTSHRPALRRRQGTSSLYLAILLCVGEDMSGYGAYRGRHLSASVPSRLSGCTVQQLAMPQFALYKITLRQGASTWYFFHFRQRSPSICPIFNRCNLAPPQRRRRQSACNPFRWVKPGAVESSAALGCWFCQRLPIY